MSSTGIGGRFLTSLRDGRYVPLIGFGVGMPCSVRVSWNTALMTLKILFTELLDRSFANKASLNRAASVEVY
jgi:hypothetical protein